MIEVVTTDVVDVVDVVGLIEVVVVVGMVVGTDVVDVVRGIDVVEVVLAALTLKFAVIVMFAFITTVHGPVPVHPPPDHPPKVDPEAAAAERAAAVPVLYAATHAFPQLIPGPATVPWPAPAFRIRRIYCAEAIFILTSFEYMLS